MDNQSNDSSDAGIFTADVKQENGQGREFKNNFEAKMNDLIDSDLLNIKVQERDGFIINVSVDRNKTIRGLYNSIKIIKIFFG